MTYKIERKGKRWALYVMCPFGKHGWILKQTYLTLKGAETAAHILYNNGTLIEGSLKK